MTIAFSFGVSTAMEKTNVSYRKGAVREKRERGREGEEGGGRRER